jgi:uncharacterized protein YfcZ (UPF0381/DUF406 family)
VHPRNSWTVTWKSLVRGGDANEKWECCIFDLGQVMRKKDPRQQQDRLVYIHA